MNSDSYLGAPEPPPPKRQPWPILVVGALVVVAVAGIIALTRGGDDADGEESSPTVELGLPGGPTDGSDPQTGEEPDPESGQSAVDGFTPQGPQGPGNTSGSGGSATGSTGRATPGTGPSTGGDESGGATGGGDGDGRRTGADGTRPSGPSIPRSPTTTPGAPGSPTTKAPTSGPTPTLAPTTTRAGIPSVSVDNTTLPDLADCYPDICLAVLSGQMANAPDDAAVYLLTRLNGGPWLVQWYSDSYRGEWVAEAEFEPFCGTPDVEVRAALFNQWLPDEIEATFPLEELAARAPGTRTVSTSAVSTIALQSNTC